MATTYGRKKRKHSNILYTVITALLICAVFLTVVNFFYTQAEDEAYEMLHIQTKQIKDDIILQLKSDRENLVTMANFAARLYDDGKPYDRMFDSFEPIGLISNIGILNPDNTFVTKMGTTDLSGKISFAEEVQRGEYISGRIKDLTRDNFEIVRSAVPIEVNNEVVGILYGVIRLEKINEKYKLMAQELDAQLFVYEKESGNFIIDSLHEDLGNVSALENRKYNDGYSYDAMISTDKGYTAFKSIYKDENMHLHYSTIEDFKWVIMLARYDSQVFAKAHTITSFMSVTFWFMILVIIVYFILILKSERRDSSIAKNASKTRKQLLEINQKPENITVALKNVMELSCARSALFVDTEGEDFLLVDEKYENHILSGEDKKYFVSELFRYALEFKSSNNTSAGVMSITPNAHLVRTNPKFYEFLKSNDINRVTFAAVTYNNNDNVSVLGVINPKNIYSARIFIEEIAICFSIAIYNKNHLNKTYAAATTDSLTNVANRVAYKKDLLILDEEMPSMFSCVYIDVNELHIRNNKYGHAAGDEMLIYIANALKSVFYGQKVYRMGGDEFLVFAQNTESETIKKCIDVFKEQLRIVDYHVAIGISYREQNTNTEEMVREAEKRMYEAKAQYYQNKQQTSISSDTDKSYVQTKTGIREIDTMISILKEHYNGIYRVSLDNDNAHRILMPSYLGYNEHEENFSKLLTKYIDDSVHPDFHRAVMTFLNYDAIKRQMAEGKMPKISYKKVNGETMTLSVYNLNENNQEVNDTLWVFAKE